MCAKFGTRLGLNPAPKDDLIVLHIFTRRYNFSGRTYINDKKPNFTFTFYSCFLNQMYPRCCAIHIVSLIL